MPFRLILTASLLLEGTALAQEDYADLDLEDLMKVEIIELVTKKPEPLFESSLSVSVLHRSEIQKSGARSIPEALRLMPGLIVREQTNGVYDVQILGFDDISSNKLLPYPSSNTMLVMIDYRVVYNYFSGGTFWETLPIGMQDIERIEFIRGPSSALYGPNAATGVINIVTRGGSSSGTSYRYRADLKSKEEYAGEATLLHRFDSGAQVSFSVNSRLHQRSSENYWDWTRSEYTSVDRLTTTLKQPEADKLDDVEFLEQGGYLLDQRSVRYPDPRTSTKQAAGNLQLLYPLGSKSSIAVNAAAQNSSTQKISVNNFSTPFTTNTSETKSLVILGKFDKISTQIANVSGEQETLGMPAWKYSLDVTDALVDYRFNLGSTLIRPELSFRKAVYDGEFIGGKQSLDTKALAIFTQNKFFNDNLQVLAAARVDSYSAPKKAYPSYQASASYKINVNNVAHAAYSKANRAPFMVDNFLDYSVATDAVNVQYSGNKDLKLLSVEAADLGYRIKFNSQMSGDVTLFRSTIYNLSDLVFSNSDAVAGSKPEVNWKYQNTQKEADMSGLTTSFTAEWTRLLKVSPYLTYQTTQYYLDAVKLSSSELSTPKFYGGLKLDYQPVRKVNVSWNSYHLARQYMPNYNLTERQELAATTISNARVSYDFDSMEVYFSARNLGKKLPQYGYGDSIESIYYIGITSDLLD